MSRYKPSTLAQLRELRSKANFERFSPYFGRGAPVTLTTPEEARAFIVEQTRIYRDTWVTPIIDALIAREEAAKEKRDARKK